MFTNVLVGVDGQPGGRDAIALAHDLVDPDGRLTLAHVHPYGFAAEREHSHQLLEQELGNADIRADLIDVVAARPGRGLHEQAASQSADLLVVGSTGHGLVGRVTLGDDTRAALNGAPCAIAIAARGYATRSVPIAKIGVAFNNTPESLAALAAARDLAAPAAIPIQALQVVSPPPISNTYYIGYTGPTFGEEIEAQLEQARQELRQIPGVEGQAVYGLPGEELALFGDDVDILVVGSRGYGPIRRHVLGSTANYLQRHARCSLLVLPRPAVAGVDPAVADADPAVASVDPGGQSSNPRARA